MSDDRGQGKLLVVATASIVALVVAVGWALSISARETVRYEREEAALARIVPAVQSQWSRELQAAPPGSLRAVGSGVTSANTNTERFIEWTLKLARDDDKGGTEVTVGIRLEGRFLKRNRGIRFEPSGAAFAARFRELLQARLKAEGLDGAALAP